MFVLTESNFSYLKKIIHISAYGDALKPVLISRILVCQHLAHKGYLLKRSGLNIFLWSMCCVLVQDTFFTLKVHLSTQEYEWVQEIDDCLGNLTNCLTSFQEEQIHILLSVIPHLLKFHSHCEIALLIL